MGSWSRKRLTRQIGGEGLALAERRQIAVLS